MYCFSKSLRIFFNFYILPSKLNIIVFTLWYLLSHLQVYSCTFDYNMAQDLRQQCIRRGCTALQGLEQFRNQARPELTTRTCLTCRLRRGSWISRLFSLFGIPLPIIVRSDTYIRYCRSGSTGSSSRTARTFGPVHKSLGGLPVWPSPC